LRKLKNGSRKYKGKLPFKCFNCGKLVHFDVKCPYAKDESSDDEEDHNIKKEIKPHQKEKRVSMKRTRTFIRKRKVSTQKRKVAHLKKTMKLSMIVKRRNSFHGHRTKN
jgi:hypothetical protein